MLLAAAAALGAGPAARAGSIWAKASARARALHSDDTARKTGDMLTIVIEEHSVITNETERGLSKKSARDVEVDTNFDLMNRLNEYTFRLFNLPQMAADIEAETSFDGSADYDSDRKVEDQITVTVADVLPNGNLVVVGSCERNTDGDHQIVQVSGVVRPSDVTFANTVRSSQVAEFKLVVRHGGREKRFTRPGWLDRILNIVNPF
jgi:flagellar L-ring protein precursor FlgH